MTIGISYLSYDIPKIYLDIEEFSKNRDINAEKLKKGLGLYKMSICDVHQDTATLAGNALYKLIADHNIDPKSINRIYLGTESALDSSKPTCTYSVEMVEDKIGERVFKHTDVVDMTFACIGAVDVFQNALDYVKANPTHKAVVIASDFAKYDLGSSGEYTQGAGAVAMLVEANPKLMSFDGEFGIGFKSEHDFYKPRRYHAINEHTKAYTTDSKLQVYREEPVFDGQFSNQCYQDRIREAYFHLKDQKAFEGVLHETWSSLIFHLPYAFHGKRIFSEIYQLEKDGITSEQVKPNLYDFEQLKATAKSEDYVAFVKEKVLDAQKASSQIGNMYAASIFMSLISELFYKKGKLKVNDTFGFIAYGSGSKSKVFEGKLVEGFDAVIEKLDLEKTFNACSPIDFKTYEGLHKKEIKNSVIPPKSEFVLAQIDDENAPLVGRRYYEYVG
jgi:hydroxymethylglutaryl-CoA synthase